MKLKVESVNEAKAEEGTESKLQLKAKNGKWIHVNINTKLKT